MSIKVQKPSFAGFADFVWTVDEIDVPIEVDDPLGSVTSGFTTFTFTFDPFVGPSSVETRLSVTLVNALDPGILPPLPGPWTYLFKVTVTSP
jgi:hypothetical protein